RSSSIVSDRAGPTQAVRETPACGRAEGSAPARRRQDHRPEYGATDAGEVGADGRYTLFGAGTGFGSTAGGFGAGIGSPTGAGITTGTGTTTGATGTGITPQEAAK